MSFLKHFFEKFVIFFRSQKNKRPFWLLTFILFVFLGIGSSFIFFQKEIVFSTKIQKIAQGEIAEKQEAITQKEELLPRFLDGVLVKKGQETLRPIAVMIDNLSIARPQDGIGKASLVIEAPVEGGITRFLAFFSSSEDDD